MKVSHSFNLGNGTQSKQRPATTRRKKAVAALFILGAGCVEQPTALVVAMTTDATTQQAIDTVHFQVTRGGEVRFSREFHKEEAPDYLPGTLTLSNGEDHDASEPMLIEIVGFAQDQKKISRSARLGFVQEKTKLLRINLSSDCLDVDCSNKGANFTCIAGKCVSNTVDAQGLPDFTNNDDALNNGNGGSSGAANCSQPTPPTVAISNTPSNTLHVGDTLNLTGEATDSLGNTLQGTWTVNVPGSDLSAYVSENQLSFPMAYCGPLVFTFTAIDSCGTTNTADFSTEVNADGGFVSSATCDSASECGSIEKPWCSIQAAIDSVNAGTVKVATNTTNPTSYLGPIVMRNGVNLEGGWDTTFSSQIDEIAADGTELHLMLDDTNQAPFAVTFGDGVTATIQNFRIVVHPPTQSATLVDQAAGILVQGSANASVVSVDIAPTDLLTGIAAKTVGVLIDSDATGQVTLDSIAVTDLTATQPTTNQPSNVSHAVLCDSNATAQVQVLGGILKGGTVLGGGTKSTGITVSGFCPLSITPSMIASDRIAPVIEGGSSNSVAYGVDLSNAESHASTLIYGATIRGSTTTNTGGNESAIHIITAAGLPMDTPQTEIVSCTLEGGRGATERFGLKVIQGSFDISASTIIGSSVDGAARLAGVYLEQSSLGSPSIIHDNELIQGGSAHFGTTQSPQFSTGIRVKRPSVLTITNNTSIVGCPSATPCTDTGVVDFSTTTVAGIILGSDTYDSGLTEWVSPPAVQISDNSAIEGGAISSPTVLWAQGIRVQNQGNTHIENNTIVGSYSEDHSPAHAAGIEVADANAQIVNNPDIFGGFASSTVFGVFVHRAAPGSEQCITEMTGNLIKGGSATDASAGLFLEGYSLPTNGPSGVIRNNEINACGLPAVGSMPDPRCLTAATTLGAELRWNDQLVFSNNYVFGGHGQTAIGAKLFDHNGTPQTSMTFVYNLFQAEGRTGGQSYGMFVDAQLTDTSSLQVPIVNNIFAPGATANVPVGLAIKVVDPTYSLSPANAYYVQSTAALLAFQLGGNNQILYTSATELATFLGNTALVDVFTTGFVDSSTAAPNADAFHFATCPFGSAPGNGYMGVDLTTIESEDYDGATRTGPVFCPGPHECL